MQSETSRPAFYSNLAALYYEEATLCFKNKCFVACIAMCWAAIDYAIDHELNGGSKLNPETLRPRPPIPFDSHDMLGKLKKLWLLFPDLRKWNDNLIFLYQCFRNTFLHGKLDNIKQRPIDESADALNAITVESGGEGFTLGYVRELSSAISDADKNPSTERMEKEVHLISATETVAERALALMERFFKELTLAISRADIPKNKEVVEQLVFDEWNAWLSAIDSDIRQALINRHIFRETMAIVQRNPRIQTDDTFFGWLRMVYSQAAVVAVRRQADRRKDVVSLARLLAEIQKSPSIISRERYVALYKGSNLPEDFGDRDFDQFSGLGKPCISGLMVERDINELKKKADSIALFSHKRVAHYDHKVFQAIPTWKELDDCLDYLEALLKKYLGIFRAEAHLNIVPTWQYDWKEIFTVPWIDRNADA